MKMLPNYLGEKISINRCLLSFIGLVTCAQWIRSGDSLQVFPFDKQRRFITSLLSKDKTGPCNISFQLTRVPEFSTHNPRALFRKSLSNNIDFFNSAPGVVYGKRRYKYCLTVECVFSFIVIQYNACNELVSSSRNRTQDLSISGLMPYPQDPQGHMLQ